MAGTGQQSGRIVNVLRNGQSVAQDLIYTHGVNANGKVNEKVFVPAKDRQRPFLLEWNVTVPAYSICELSFEFDKAFLRVNEYPPDANHGFYIPAPVIILSATADLWHKNRTALGSSLVTAFEEFVFMHFLQLCNAENAY
ncbi:unnamed protein product [Gongylonema pulchrum]|uniref:Uncharacterized protein n=1 Tax=Gongylonema pulchrum TaxID=637853 RepID=A0A3P7Q8H5_9BILA|nr:unnamed protein product [Gongylonema pulchrum]